MDGILYARDRFAHQLLEETRSVALSGASSLAGRSHRTAIKRAAIDSVRLFSRWWWSGGGRTPPTAHLGVTGAGQCSTPCDFARYLRGI